MSVKSLTMLTRCQRGRWLRLHDFGVVIDYSVTVFAWLLTTPKLLEKIWRPLTDFKGLIRQKNVFWCVYIPNGNSLKIWKTPHPKKVACLQSERLRGLAIFELCDQISSRKQKLAKLFMSVHMGPKKNLVSQKNYQKSCATVPLTVELFHE